MLTIVFFLDIFTAPLERQDDKITGSRRCVIPIAIATAKVNAVKLSCFDEFKMKTIGIRTSINLIRSFEIDSIPFWKEVVEMIYICCKDVPGARYVGWDVAITKDGPCLIEGNTGNNAYRILQAADGIGKWEIIRNLKRMHD